MIKQRYIILILSVKGMEYAPSLLFNHEFEAKDWINENGKEGIGYVVMKEYSI